MQTATFRSNATLGHANVDRANGIIKDVSVITEGEIRGWGMLCDAACIASIKQYAEARGPAGLGVKFNPSTFDHGPGGMAGFLHDFYTEGNQLFAREFNILPNFPAKEYLLDLAQFQPGSFGLSVDISYDAAARETAGLCRCLGIDAVTIVDVPAANVGLFSIGKKKPPVDAPAQKSQVQIVIAALRRPKFPTALLKR